MTGERSELPPQGAERDALRSALSGQAEGTTESERPATFEQAQGQYQSALRYLEQLSKLVKPIENGIEMIDGKRIIIRPTGDRYKVDGIELLNSRSDQIVALGGTDTVGTEEEAKALLKRALELGGYQVVE